MPDIPLSIAMRAYDRVRPIMDGTVRIDGVDPVFMSAGPEEIFFRAFRNGEFDVCEMSLSSYTVKTSRGECPYVAIPVFPSRLFRHTSFYVRGDSPLTNLADLKGKRIGLPEYQLTACVWGRMMDEAGVRQSDVTWVRGGLEQAGRVEKIALDLPADVRLEEVPEHTTLTRMLAEGEIDCLLSPRTPDGFERRDGSIRWLLADPTAAARDYYHRTGHYPIMHVLGVKRALADKNEWLPGALMRAFSAAKDEAVAFLRDVSASAVSLPFLEEAVHAASDLFGPDLWPYGLDENRATLDAFLHHHHAQGLSSRRLAPEDLFHPNTLETFKV